MQKPIVGLIGTIIAVASSELNDQVVNFALQDVSGNLGLDQDAAAWLRSLYVTGQVIGMCVSAALALSFSMRRFLLFSIGMTCAAGLLLPFNDALPWLFGLRFLQGMGQGFVIAILIPISLRVLDPPIRLYGLALYAMTATFSPNIGASMAALWVDVVGDWRLVFWEVLPTSALAALLVWHGMHQDAPQYDRLAKFDWRGALLVAVGAGAFSTVVQQGERYDWFNSPQITLATVVSVAALPLFVLVESRVELPLIKVSLLKQRNFAYAAITLVTFIIISQSASVVPITFLEQVHGYRPLQAQWITVEVAALQLALLPAVAWLLDREWVDSRLVSAAGLSCILLACIGGLFVNSAWTRDQFYLLQALQAVGEPLVVMPLLLMATNALAPKDAPFGTALVNTPRAVAEAGSFGMLSLISRWRGGLHRNRILDALGQNGLALAQQRQLPALRELNRVIGQQVAVLDTIDTYLFMGLLVIFLLVVLAVLPERTYPPRIALARTPP